MTSITDHGTSNIQYLSYGYDADNNVHTVTDNVTPANSKTLTYDAIDRLTNSLRIIARGHAPYAPGNRGLWLKVKCLNREEFVVVRWTDPEGRRPLLGASFVIIGPFGRFRLWQRGRSAMVMEDAVASIDRRDALCAGTLRVG